MNNKSFEEQLRLLSLNGIPEAGELINKLEELASERSYSSIEMLLRQFDVTEERRIKRHNQEASSPMSRLQILRYYKTNGIWPPVKRVRRQNPFYPVSRGNVRRIRDVQRYVDDYIY